MTVQIQRSDASQTFSYLIPIFCIESDAWWFLFFMTHHLPLSAVIEHVRDILNDPAAGVHTVYPPFHGFRLWVMLMMSFGPLYTWGRDFSMYFILLCTVFFSEKFLYIILYILYITVYSFFFFVLFHSNFILVCTVFFSEKFLQKYKCLTSLQAIIGGGSERD